MKPYIIPNDDRDYTDTIKFQKKKQKWKESGMSEKDIEKLINVFNEDTSFIVIPKYKNRFGNPVIYPKKYKEDILNLEGDKGGKSIIKSSDKIKYVDVCENTLFDIDNIDDFNNLLKRETVYEK